MNPLSTADMTPATSLEANKIPRLWHLLLLGVVLIGAVPLVVLGKSEFISYDGFWHLFIANQDNWDVFMTEYRGDAHPILYLLLLKLIAPLGQSHLALRSISIASAVGSIWLMGQIGFLLYKNKAIGLLLSASYAFSITMLEINIDLRSYPFCLLFVLWAFYSLLRFIQSDFGNRSGRELVLFGLFSSAAIASEYYAIFFFATSIAALVPSFFIRADVRRRLRLWVGRDFLSPALALILPISTTIFFYVTHMQYQPASYGHVSDFYWVHGTSVGDFIVRNLRADLNYILPFTLPSLDALVSVLVWLIPAMLVVPLTIAEPVRAVSQFLTSLTALFLTIELALLGVLDRYPFGGFERQQSILFPFYMIAGYLIFDRLQQLLSTAWLRAVAVALCAILLAMHFESSWKKMPRTNTELFSEGFGIIQNKIPPGRPIYIDQFSIIAYYIHTHDWRWHFVRLFRVPDRIEEYDLTEKSGQHFSLLRNFDLWNFDLHNPEMYRTLAVSLNTTRIPTADLLLVKQVASNENASQLAEEDREIRKLAAAAGLNVGNIYENNDLAVVQFMVAH